MVLIPPERINNMSTELRTRLHAPAAEEELAFRASEIFEQAQHTHHLPVTITGWAKPESVAKPQDDDRTVIRNVMDRYRSLVTVPVPDPEWARKRRSSFESAERVFVSGLMRGSGHGELDENVAGAYLYKPLESAVGTILFQKQLLELAHRLGELVVTTAAHEGTHTDDHRHGFLSPCKIIAGEIEAFTRQARTLIDMDPTGHKTARAWVDAQRAGSPKFLRQYVQHLVGLRWAYLNGRLLEFIEGLGYRDPAHAH